MAEKIRLGDRVQDRMTGFKGIVTGMHEFITGCAKATVQPEEMKDGKPLESQWFDIQHLKIVKAGAFVSDNGTTPGGPMAMPREARPPR